MLSIKFDFPFFPFPFFSFLPSLLVVGVVVSGGQVADRHWGGATKCTGLLMLRSLRCR